jgi:hypothetical protein
LQNAVSFNYYANNEIYDPRPDTIKINGNVTEIVDGEKDITGEKNKAPLAQDTAGLTNKVEPVKDQVKEEVVANSGTENTQIITNPDEIIFSNSAIFKNYFLDIDYSTDDKLNGRFAVFDGGITLSKEYDAVLKLSTGMSSINVAKFKIKPDDNGKPNHGQFITEKGGWREVLSQVSDPKDNRVIFSVYIPEFKFSYYKLLAIASFECPEEDIKLDNIVNYKDWERILEDPCCSCWPNGTGTSNIIINSVKCPSSGCTTN